MKTSKYLFLAVLMLVISTPLFAQGGCVESPEDPTLVLALLGSAAASVVYARDRMKSRSDSGQK